MALLMLGRLSSNLRFASTLSSFGIGLLLLFPVFGFNDPMMGFNMMLPGFLLDFSYHFGGQFNRKAWFDVDCRFFVYADSCQPSYLFCFYRISVWRFPQIWPDNSGGFPFCFRINRRPVGNGCFQNFQQNHLKISTLNIHDFIRIKIQFYQRYAHKIISV